MEPILQVQNLNYFYSMGTPFQHQALENVSFSVSRGEFIGIIGHTGSGKSTLMQQLNGLLKPTSGTVLLDGQEQPDLLTDDTALTCKTPEGLFIVTGCSHSGICNIVSHAQHVCGEARIAGILGGFHLPRANSRVQKTAAFLKSLNPGALYPCHCVSLAAKVELAKVLPIQEVGSGMCINF